MTAGPIMTVTLPEPGLLSEPHRGQLAAPTLERRPGGRLALPTPGHRPDGAHGEESTA